MHTQKRTYIYIYIYVRTKWFFRAWKVYKYNYTSSRENDMNVCGNNVHHGSYELPLMLTIAVSYIYVYIHIFAYIEDGQHHGI